MSDLQEILKIEYKDITKAEVKRLKKVFHGELFIKKPLRQDPKPIEQNFTSNREKAKV